MSTITITCPNCGRRHQVETTHYQGMFLNGMPKISMKDFMAMTKICDCGLLVASKEWSGIKTKEILPTEGYQKILKKKYASETLKKLDLFVELYHFYHYELYYVLYYEETRNTKKRNEHLEAAIERVMKKIDKQDYIINGETVYGISDTKELHLSPALRLVDYYRCLGKFEDATKQIKKCQRGATDVMKAWLAVEAQLIEDENTSIL